MATLQDECERFGPEARAEKAARLQARVDRIILERSQRRGRLNDYRKRSAGDERDR